MDTTAKHMTIAACPEGGFMVYSRAEEHEAFERNRHMVPIAGFASLKAALAFVESKMAPAAPASTVNVSQTADLRRLTSTLEWHDLSGFPQGHMRLLCAVHDDQGAWVSPGHWDPNTQAFRKPSRGDGEPGAIIRGVQRWAFMPDFPSFVDMR